MAFKLTMTDCSVDQVGTFLKAMPDADIEYTAKGTTYRNVGKMFDLSDDKATEVESFLASLPKSVTEAQVAEVMAAVKQAPANDVAREAAIKKTPFWDAVKDMGTEIIAKTIMVALGAYIGV